MHGKKAVITDKQVETSDKLVIGDFKFDFRVGYKKRFWVVYLGPIQASIIKPFLENN